MESNRLQIRRLRAEYLVPAQHPAPEQIKGRLDKAVSKQLPAALASAFSSWFSETDPSLWFIRRLDIDVAVNAAWDGERLARAFTTQIGRTLSETLQETAERDNVVHFSNRVTYLASFLIDLAAGHAWSLWYYESFAGLRMLPTSAALRTVICDQTEPGREALNQLSSRDLQEVLRALSRNDAEVILDHLASTAAAGDEVDCCQWAWNAWQTIEPNSLNDLDEMRRALLLYLTASRDQRTAGLNLKRASFSMLRLASRLAADSTDQQQQLLAALTGGGLADLYQVAGADAEILLPLLRCSPNWLIEVAQAINTRPSKQTPDGSATPDRRYTSLGGAFLLLPFIDELPLGEATRAWPHADESAAISLVRFLLLVKCCGERNAERSFADPLLRDLLLIPPAISIEDLREWQSRIPATGVQNFLQVVLAWQRSQGNVKGGKQILAQTVVKGGPVLILTDGTRGLWVMAETYEPGDLIDALRESMAQLESDDGVLFCDPPLLERLWPEFPSARMISLENAEADEVVSRIVTRIDKLSDDLAHLALPGAFQLSPEVDLALSLVAQNVMRAFAWRVPGFALSNLSYLWGNFLDFPASLDEEPGRRVVRAGRPPLRLVLGPTGLMRQAYRLSWLDERPLNLFEES